MSGLEPPQPLKQVVAVRGEQGFNVGLLRFFLHQRSLRNRRQYSRRLFLVDAIARRYVENFVHKLVVVELLVGAT